MKHIVKKWLAGILSVVMVFSLLPVMASAEEDGETPEKTAAEKVQKLIDALPDAETITEDNRVDVEAQIDAIDAAMAELTGDEAASLDTTRYEAAVAALLALDAPSALEQVQALIDALPEAETITDDNRADVEAQLSAIDEAKLGLEDEELDGLDITRYMAAVEALLALDNMAGANEPETMDTEFDVSTQPVNIDKDGDYTIKGNTTANTITVTSGTVTITLNGVSVTSNGGCAFDIQSGNVTLILEDGTTNSFTSAGNFAGIRVAEGASLTIKGTGTLNATAKKPSENTRIGAGIGGNYNDNAGRITIESGTIVAKSEGDGAGIGGGHTDSSGKYAKFQSITISGGKVTAEAGGNGAGIGCGCWATTMGTITISGGEIHAKSTSKDKKSFDIGYGHRSSDFTSNITISGGVVFTEGSHGRGIGAKTVNKNNCIIFPNSGSVEFNGNPSITSDFTIPSGKTLTVPSGSTLTVAEGATLTNEGSISNSGNIVISGTGELDNKNEIYNAGSIEISYTGNLNNEEGTIKNVKGYGKITGDVTGTQPEVVEGVSYLDWDQNTKTLVEKAVPTTIQVGDSTTTWENNWYVVSGNVTISDRITIKGTVHLILMDDCTLTAQNGISVNPGNSLTIYGQSGQSGSLSATGSEGNAGIGGDNLQGFGTITINGGIIIADGYGNGSSYRGGAGIGGGGTKTQFLQDIQSTGGTVTINGGTVTADGGETSAGVGGGYDCNNVTITINGGTVVATGLSSSAGIGGGESSKNVAITINEGNVTATGGSYGPGIGCAMDDSDGITTININGGTVTATGGSSSFLTGGGGAGIGGADDRYYGTMTININGGTVTATGGRGCAGIGRYSNDSTNISFSTGKDGNAVIVASGISDKGQQNSWSGIIIEGNTGKIYGTPTPKYNFEIPSGKTLNVENGHPLHIASDVTMTNKGTINIGTNNDMEAVLNNEGSIINEGKIDVWGLLTHGEDGIEKRNSGEIVYHFNLAVDAPTFAEAKYGYSQPSALKITIKNNGQVDANITSVEIDESGFDLIEGDIGNVAQGATNDSWSVQPKAGLSIGTHTATITVTYSGNGGTSRTATAEVSFTVTQATSTVKVSASDEPTYGSDITLTAEVTAPGVTESEINDNVTFKAGVQELGTVKAENGTATLTIKANDRDLQHKLFGTNGENVTVTAEYAGNSNIEKSTGTETVTITPKTLTFTFKATDRTYDTTTKVEGSFDVKGKVDGDNVNVSDYTANVEDKDVGNAKDVAAEVTELSGDDAKYYTPGAVTGGTVNITQATLDLTVADVSITYGTKLTNDLLDGSTAKITGIEKPVTGTWAWDESIQNTMPAVSDSGIPKYKVVFTPSSDDAKNFTEASLSTEITITVKKATPTVTVEAVTGTYGDNITIIAKVTVPGVDASLVTGTIKFEDGGTLDTVGVENGTATLTISGSERNKQHALFGSNGSSNVTATYSGDSNIDGGSDDATVNITPKALTYTVTATGREYNGEKTVNVALTPVGLVDSDDVTLTATGELSSADANTYHQVNLSNITKEGADAKYYSVDDSASNKELQDGVTISPKVVALDWKLDGSDAFTISYDGGPHTATATVNNKVNSDEVGVTVEVKPDSGTGAGPYNATATDAGNYTATATGLTGGAKDNYTLNGSDTATQAITISKVLATCTTPPTANEDLTYMGEAQKLVTAGTTAGGTMMYALGENGSTEPGNDAFDSDIPTGADAKTYYVWYYVQGDGNHGDSEKKCVEVTIGPAKVSFTIGAENKADWDAKGETNADPNPTGYTVTGDGTKLSMTYDSYTHTANVTQKAGEAVEILPAGVNGFTVTYKRVKDSAGNNVNEAEADEIQDAGTYDIMVNLTPTEGDIYNYAFDGQDASVHSLKIGEITVEPYTVHVTWSHLKYVYHAHKMHPNVRVQNAFKADVQPNVVPDGFEPAKGYDGKLLAFAETSDSKVGDYDVEVELYGTSAGNYTVDDNTETVTIVPAPVTFTVGDNVWVIGEGGALSRDTVTLRPAWGAVSTTPDVAVHHSYPLAGTKLDVDTLNVTIEYWQNGEKVEAPSEAGKYEVWVEIGNENYRHSATETGELHHVGELVITDDPNSIRTYTVTFDPGYEGAAKGPAAIEKAFPNQTVVLPPVSGKNGDGTTYDITRPKYSFLGWSYNGHTYQPNEELHMPAADVTFKGEWIEAVQVGGRVVQESSGGEPTPVNGATVVLKQGSEPTAEAVTGSDGTFDFGLVTPGIYNLEVTYENGGGAKIVKTFLVEVGDSGSVDNEFVLPGSALNTVVEVAPGIKSAVSMDGMITDEAATDVYTESDKQTVAEGGTVEFKMSISETTLTDDQGEEIPVPEERISMVLDMKLTKTVTSSSGTSTTEITDSKIPVTTVIHLPAEIQGKSGYTVYRFHDEDGDDAEETMQTITTSKNENGEYLEVIRDGTAIELHAEFYSTYVLTWYQSSGGGATAYPVTLPENALNGTVTANYEKAVKNSVVTLTVTPDEGHVLGELTVTDSDGNPIALTDNGDGTYTFVMPDGGVTVKAVFNCEGGENCQSRKFTDLDVKAWYHDYTDYVIGCGLMHGVGGKLFDPNGAVTRAQMVTVLWNMSGDPVVNYYMTYSDVSESAWYAEAIRWATSEGVVDGYGNGLFGPNDPITREQMTTMIYRYEQKYGDGGFTGDWMYRLPFKDLDQISDWAFEAVAWCNMKGIITGKDGNRVDPKGSAKRCEMAAVLTRYRYENDIKNDTE